MKNLFNLIKSSQAIYEFNETQVEFVKDFTPFRFPSYEII